MRQHRIIDLVLSVLASAVGFVLSWPFWRDMEYWAESRTMWCVYFIAGFLMSVYVFYIFLNGVHTLFLHDSLVKSGYYKPEGNREETK